MFRDEITAFIKTYFGADLLKKAQNIDPENANNIQIKGARKITGIALGVSENLEFFKKANEKNCNFLIVHHGMRFHKMGLYINKIYKERLKYLFDKQMTLAGFHFILDHHKKIGNNAQIITKLGGKIKENFFDEWGWIGEFEKRKSIKKVKQELKALFKREPLAEYLYGRKEIKKIAVVSGGAALRTYQDELTQILENDVDLYITGEAKESTAATCKEAGINYLAYGHYDTEVFGVKALQKVLQKKYPKLPIEFIDIPNRL